MQSASGEKQNEPEVDAQPKEFLASALNIDENDIVIAVMGSTGTGKSSFINIAVGGMEVEIGHDLKSQTRKIQPVRCQHPNGSQNIILVDTPGFDDTHLSDTEILNTIADWLKETYQNNIKLSGLLYLHSISDNKMARTALRNLTVFRKLCGKGNLGNIILVTTKWDRVDESMGNQREEELRSIFWKGMISLGSQTCRFEGTRRSAWDIINVLDLKGHHQRLKPLQIQREMVDRGLPFPKTSAGKTMLHSFKLAGLKKAWEKFHKVWSVLSRDSTTVPSG